MTSFAEPVLAFAADDRHFGTALRFLALVRASWPDLPILLIPRAGPVEQLAAFGDAYRFTMLDRDFADLDLLADICFDTHPERDRLRRFAVFDVQAPSVLCVDPAMHLLTDPRPLLVRLAASAVPVGVRSPDGSGFAVGGPSLGVARVATALRENLADYMSDREAGGIEAQELQFSLAALGLPADVAPDWPGSAPLGPWVGAAVPVVGLRNAAADLAELDNGGSYRRQPAEVVDAPPALVAGGAHGAAQETVDPPPALLARLCSVTVLERGFVITAAGELVQESLIHTAGDERFGPFLRDPDGIIRLATEQPVAAHYGIGPYILLKQRYDGNYGHFLVDSLARLDLVAERLNLTDCTIIIGEEPGTMRQVFRDTLALLGVAPDRILVLPDAPAFFAELIFAAPLTVSPTVKAPRVIRFLEELGRRVPDGLSGPARVYVSRNQLARRRLLNEAAIFQRLESRGYVFVEPETLDFADQVRMFRCATHVIGTLGAALTNVAFAPRGVQVLALTTQFMQDDFLWDLVSLRDGRYVSLHGPASHPEANMQSDFSVDIDRFEQILATFDAAPPAPASVSLPAQVRVTEAIGIFCKSFADDFPRLRLLLESLSAHNVEAIPFALSLPEHDIQPFREQFGPANFPVLADHELTGLRQPAGEGWTYQQLVKLCCDRSGIAENLFVVDSDTYFIRPFRRAELVDRDGVPFAMLAPHGHDTQPGNLPEVAAWVAGGPAREFSEAALRRLRSGRVPALTDPEETLKARRNGTNLAELFSRANETYYCMPGPVLQGSVLRAIRRQKPARDSDAPATVPALLINLSPWEYVWHAEYLLASALPLPIRPLRVFHIHSDVALAEVRRLGLTESRLARRYCGVQMAARHFDEQRLGG